MDIAIIIAAAFLAILCLAIEILSIYEKNRFDIASKSLKRLLRASKAYEPKSLKKPEAIKNLSVTGIYLIKNKTKNRYYVGQAVRAIDRVNKHFQGAGSMGVYKDYLAGDKFIVSAIPLKRTRFKSLNEMERSAIFVFDAYTKGYNKTKGNS